jgi:hypothetical protein
MVPTTDPEQNTAERLIVVAITGSWALWFVGGLYIVGPALGWTLAAMAGWHLYSAGHRKGTPAPVAIGWTVWLWLAGMAAMLIILWAGHAQYALGTGQTIKSSIGWAKGWALLALFPFAGSVLPIRLSVLARAVCRLGAQTLLLLPLFLLAPSLGLPQTLWVSPLKILGGAGDEYFAVILYTLEPGTGAARWQFFAPWSPAAGLVAIIHILCALEERDLRWKVTGIFAGIMMALMSQSRLALLALAIVWPMAWLASKLYEAKAWFAAAPTLLLAGWFAPALSAMMTQAQADFAGARADSSRVRATLGRIAVERWQNEAYWFGHGIVERGPHLVEYMPIGSHHSWYGLLFVKGVLGAAALALPMAATLLATARAAMISREGRLGFAMALVYLMYSFGENLEVVSYLGWPALLIIGMALRHPEKAERRHLRATFPTPISAARYRG